MLFNICLHFHMSINHAATVYSHYIHRSGECQATTILCFTRSFLDVQFKKLFENSCAGPTLIHDPSALFWKCLDMLRSHFLVQICFKQKMSKFLRLNQSVLNGSIASSQQVSAAWVHEQTLENSLPREHIKMTR